MGPLLVLALSAAQLSPAPQPSPTVQTAQAPQAATTKHPTVSEKAGILLTTLAHRLPVPPADFHLRRAFAIGQGDALGYGSMATALRYTQMQHGYPVQGDRIILLLDKAGLVQLSHFNPLPPLPAPERPLLSMKEATLSVQGHSPIHGDVGGQILWVGQGESARLTWRLQSREPGGRAFAYYVDAQTGAFRGREEEGSSVGPEANTYLTNPYLESEATQVSLPELIDDTLRTSRLTYYQGKDRQKLVNYEAADGNTYATHVCDYVFQAAPADGSFLYDPIPFPDDPARDEDDFVGPHLLYTLNNGLNIFSDMGVEQFTGEPFYVIGNSRWPNALDESLLTDRTAPLDPLNNAYFSPPYYNQDGNLVSGTLLVGQGSLSDFGYDSDVVYHELGHGLVHTLDGPRYTGLDSTGFSYEPSALNEAYADYFSSIIQGDGHVGEYAALTWKPEGEGIRDLDEFVACPDDVINQQHNDSQVFSGALWAMRKTLAVEERENFDLMILAALSQTPSTSSIKIGSQVVVDTAFALLGSEYSAALTSFFNARGALTCERIHTVIPLGIDEPLLPYTPLVGGNAVGTEDPMPSGIQFKIELPEKPKNKTIRIRFLQAQYKGVPLYAYGYSRAPKNMVVLAKAGGEPIRHESTLTDETTVLSHDAEAVATADLLEDVTPIEGSKYTYPAFEAEWEVKKVSGSYYIQLANVDPDTAWGYNYAIEVTETEGCGGCSTASRGSATGSLLLFSLLAIGRRRKKRGPL